MKIPSIFIILLFCYINLFGQEDSKYNYEQGYKFIKKAQEFLEKGDLEKAEKFIIKAKESNYGFCGNAWASAYSIITTIEVQVLNKQKKYDKALTILDSLGGCSYGADCSIRDSLKATTLFLKFGVEKVKHAFKNLTSANNLSNTEFELSYWVFIDTLNYKFCFKTDYPIILNEKKVEQKKTINDFHDLAKNQAFYKLIE